MRILATVFMTCMVVSTWHVALSAEAAKGAGLSKTEATSVANRFFAKEMAIEGAVAQPSERGDFWVFPVKIGYAGVVARDPILVNRFTGHASWAGLAEHRARMGRSKQQTSK